MARTTVLSVRESRWQDGLPSLKRKYEDARKVGQHAARLIVEFAAEYYAAWREAKDLQGDGDKRVKQLNRAIFGTELPSPSWISNLRSIGKAASWLLPHAAQLPPSMDSLKALAAAGADESVPLLKKGNISALSTIQDTRQALDASPAPSRLSIRARDTYDGTLSFRTAEVAARVFAETLIHTDAKLTLGDKGTVSALQQHLGKEAWKKVKSRVKW